MLTAVLRDADAMPIVAEIEATTRLPYLAGVEDGLVAGWGDAGRRPSGCAPRSASRSTSTPGRTLHTRGLGRAEAIAVMAAAVGAALRP